MDVIAPTGMTPPEFSLLGNGLWDMDTDESHPFKADAMCPTDLVHPAPPVAVALPAVPPPPLFHHSTISSSTSVGFLPPSEDALTALSDDHSFGSTNPPSPSTDAPPSPHALMVPSPMQEDGPPSSEETQEAEEEEAEPEPEPEPVRPAKRQKTTRKRRRAADPATLALRRKKHNEVEIRRRKRIAESFSELRELTHCEDPSKGAILKATIDYVRDLQSCSGKPAGRGRGRRSQTDILGDIRAQVARSGIAMAALRHNGDIVDSNPAFADIVGQLPPHSNLFKLASSSIRHVHQQLQSQPRSGSASCEATLSLPSGTFLEVRYTAWIVKDHRGAPSQYLQGIFLPM